MTGKGAIACTDPLSAGLFGRYDRIANALIEEADVLLVVGCKLGEIATKRFTIPRKGKTVIHLDIVAGGVRPHLSADGGAVGGRARGHPRPRGRARRATPSGCKPSARDWVGRRGRAHGGVEGRRHGAADVDRDAHQRGAHAARAQRRHAGRRHPGRRRRLRRALGGAALRHQAGRARLRARSRLCLDRLRPARGHRRGAGRQGPPGRRRSRATAASTCRSAISRRRGAWACRSPSSSSTTRPRAT